MDSHYISCLYRKPIRNIIIRLFNIRKEQDEKTLVNDELARENNLCHWDIVFRKYFSLDVCFRTCILLRLLGIITWIAIVDCQAGFGQLGGNYDRNDISRFTRLKTTRQTTHNTSCNATRGFS